MVEWSCILLRLKSWSTKGASDHPAFMVNYSTVSHTFSVSSAQRKKNMWGHSNISSYCSCVWCESRESGGIVSSKFLCITPVAENSSEKVTFRILPNINDGAPVQKRLNNGLNTLFVSTEKLHHRPPIGFQMRIRLGVL